MDAVMELSPRTAVNLSHWYRHEADKKKGNQ
jgi:hypothetical protein